MAEGNVLVLLELEGDGEFSETEIGERMLDILTIRVCQVGWGAILSSCLP